MSPLIREQDLAQRQQRVDEVEAAMAAEAKSQQETLVLIAERLVEDFHKNVAHNGPYESSTWDHGYMHFTFERSAVKAVRKMIAKLTGEKPRNIKYSVDLVSNEDKGRVTIFRLRLRR